MVTVIALALLLGPAAAKVEVTATFVPAGKETPPAISVTLQPEDPDVHVNETPAPRLALGEGQKLLVYDAPPTKFVPPVDPADAKYLDPAIPVLFPVALRSGAPKGTQDVQARVTYFYCSKREGWCRKGTADVDVPVTVR